MRNLGGAVGIAVIDTVIYTRAPEHAQALVSHLAAGDLDTARRLAIPNEILTSALFDPEKQAIVSSIINKAAFVEAINDAWALIALVTIIGLLIMPLARGYRGPNNRAPFVSGTNFRPRSIDGNTPAV